MSDWETFLTTVDMPPANDILEKLSAWFIAAGLTAPEACSGPDETDLTWSELSVITERTFARRAIRAAIQADQIKSEVAKASKVVQASNQQQGNPAGSLVAHPMASQPLLI